MEWRVARAEGDRGVGSNSVRRFRLWGEKGQSSWIRAGVWWMRRGERDRNASPYAARLNRLDWSRG